MNEAIKEEEIVIVGGGMSGTVMAYIMANRGYKVKIYEKRSDCRKNTLKQGRSVNLTLAERGIRSLEKIGIDRQDLFEMCIGLKGRQIHKPNGKVKFQAYGSKADELIYSIIRYDLNCFLLDYVEKHPNIEIIFNQKCVGLDKATRTVTFQNLIDREKYKIKPKILFGADGTHSKVRKQMQKGTRANYSQFFLDAGYKELKIPPNEKGDYRLDKTCLHLWPQGETLLIALSNNDGSFTCTCILPHSGRNGFQNIKTNEDCKSFFDRNFPGFLGIVPNAVDMFQDSPISEFITTKTSKWYHDDWIVLIGDACHTVTPFYGQGMNTALEGCWVLANCIEENKDNLKIAFNKYQQNRKKNTDLLADLSVKNYYELRDKVRYPSIDFKKNINFLMQKLFPKHWLPLYTMISHTSISYSKAVEIEKKQNKILNLLGVGVISATMDFGAYLLLKAKGKGSASKGHSEVQPRTNVVNNSDYGHQVD